MADLVSDRWFKHTDEEPDQYNVVMDQAEGFALKLGDRVGIPWDISDNSGGEFFEGDEGIVIGFTKTNPGTLNPLGSEGVVIAFKGSDPQTMDEPDNLACLDIISSEED